MNVNSDTMLEPEIIKVIKIWQASNNTNINLRQKDKMKFSFDLNIHSHSNIFLVRKNWQHSALLYNRCAWPKTYKLQIRVLGRSIKSL